MVYPVQRGHSYHKRTKKKKRSKLPFIITIIVIIIIASCGFVFFLHNSLLNSKEMTDDRVDYVFYMRGLEKIFFIRTDRKQKINYLIDIPKISYEPIMAISMDQPSPREISRSVEKLFGAPNSTYYSSIDENSYQTIKDLSVKENEPEYTQLTISQFVEMVESIHLDWYEFLLFNKTKKWINAQNEHNYTKNSAYRLINNISKYANKAVPMTFMTKAPVEITVKDNQGNQKKYQRLYIDDKSLDTIMEFMKK
ncbi:MAG: hypothetical protein PWQ84_5 [Thermotogaceae bacterium]|jgi:hypothetical protein|nr:hypothetical protein [Thermotogaceae bacterium]